MRTHLVSLAALAFVAWAPGAFAQQAQPDIAEHSYFSAPVQAPKQAFELTIGSGYTQGFGLLQSGVAMVDVVRPGITLDVGAAYRANPHWSFGATTQYQEIYAQRANSARGFAAGLDATYHLMPFVRTDPWLQVGTGYRMLWEAYSQQPDLVTHGFELGRVVAGVDLHASEDIALSPVIGADLDMFVWQDGGAGAVAIKEPRASTFIFAGLQGRIDIGGTRVNESKYWATK